MTLLIFPETLSPPQTTDECDQQLTGPGLWKDAPRRFTETAPAPGTRVGGTPAAPSPARGLQDSPIQHSKRAQGVVFTTSGGSTPTFRHSTRATLTVFICKRNRKNT